jgi:hypothetical protein
MVKKTNGNGGSENDLAKAVDSIAEELRPLYKIEDLNEALNNIASALSESASVTRFGILAQFGTKEDREAALRSLRDISKGY